MSAGAGLCREWEEKMGRGRKHQLAARELGSGRLLHLSAQQRKAGGEGSKEGQELGERSESEAGNGCWLKYFQQLQSICATCPLIAVVAFILSWYAIPSPSAGAELPWPLEMLMPSLDPPRRSACAHLSSAQHTELHLPCRPGLVPLLQSALSLLDCLFLALFHLLWHSDCNYPFQCWEGSWQTRLKEKKGAALGVGETQIGTIWGFSLPWKTVLLLSTAGFPFPPRASEHMPVWCPPLLLGKTGSVLPSLWCRGRKG